MKKKIANKIKECKLIMLDIPDYTPLQTTIEYYMILKQKKELDEPDINMIKETLKLLQIPGRRDNVIKGLYRKLPNVDTILVDRNTILAVCCSTAIRRKSLIKFAREVAYYGWVHAYSYDNVTPRRFTFEGRLSLSDIYVITQIGAMQFSPLCYLAFCIRKLIESYYKKQESKTHLLNWMIFQNIGRKWYNKWIYSFWKYMMTKKFTNGAEDMFKFRYGDGSALHRLCNGISF